MQPNRATDRRRKDTAINKNERALDEDAYPPGEALAPDAALRDGIDDDVSPYLTLEVDRLTSNGEREGRAESRPHGAAADDEPAPGTSIRESSPGTDGLEVYGWEASLWSKIRGYLGF